MRRRRECGREGGRDCKEGGTGRREGLEGGRDWREGGTGGREGREVGKGRERGKGREGREGQEGAAYGVHTAWSSENVLHVLVLLWSLLDEDCLVACRRWSTGKPATKNSP